MNDEQGETLKALVGRATDAFAEAQEAKSARARSRAETRFYANCESIYWLLRASAQDSK